MPPVGHRVEPPLAPESLVVTVINQAGHRRTFDFSCLPVAEPMRRSLAASFAAQSRRWNTHGTALSYWDGLLTFARFLSGLEHPPQDLDGLTVAMLKRWRARHIATSTGKYTLGKIATLLHRDPRLDSGPVAEELARRVPRPDPSRRSYGEEEREQLLLVARRQFRSAWMRIRENTQLLERGRAGEVAEGSREWRISQVLDHLAHTGDVPRTVTPGGYTIVTNHRILDGSTAERTWGRLFLTRAELTALGVLLTDRFGWNLSAYDRMPTPTTAPSAGESTTVTYQVQVEKRRAGAGRWFSTENVTDSGADSPGRLITQALEATAHGRALAAQLAPGTDLLMTARTRRADLAARDLDRPLSVGPLIFGISRDDAKVWARWHNLGGSPFQRTRRTTVTREARPLQHTQGTHESVYVLPDEHIQHASQAVFEHGALEALEQARTIVFTGSLTEKPDPGHHKTATADCADPSTSPWPAPDGSRGADFLLCLACRNAHVHPGHHARLAHLHQQLHSLRSALPDRTWNARWREHLLRLEDLRDKIGPAAWAAALERASDTDRTLVRLLLNGDLAP
ncbi:hypothetical protein ACFTY8_45860 [Streptomyces mirabilis]|uniref:hypothetical protein n=1 Tax=Streptomyces mirabilis TaxID=68239 RepID=UPI003636406E